MGRDCQGAPYHNSTLSSAPLLALRGVSRSTLEGGQDRIWGFVPSPSQGGKLPRRLLQGSGRVRWGSRRNAWRSGGMSAASTVPNTCSSQLQGSLARPSRFPYAKGRYP